MHHDRRSAEIDLQFLLSHSTLRLFDPDPDLDLWYVSVDLDLGIQSVSDERHQLHRESKHSVETEEQERQSNNGHGEYASDDVKT